MVSVGLYETPFSSMLPGHNGFGGPFYPHAAQYHQDYFPQHFSQPFSSDVNHGQNWTLPTYQPTRSVASTTNSTHCPEWSFPQTPSTFVSSNQINNASTPPYVKDSCLELEQPISVNTDVPGSPQSAIISSTHSPGDPTSPKSCNRYTCYDWAKRPDRLIPSPSDPPPNKWKTRTKDKYRVVYTDRQRLELEKEFHYSRYITINRKSELSKTLDLSERQIKIWFQNRRAKERKINKKKSKHDDKEPVTVPTLPVSMPLQMTSLPGGQGMTSLRRDEQYTPVGMGYQPPHPVAYPASMMQNHHHMNLGYGMKNSLDSLNSGFVKSEYTGLKAEYPHQ